ncbi:hypothetical protein JYU34_000532 [Plutella xylostella]|uniref:Uncharacterized protein n=1 Tax=Plutella xylostella TaxID=51655 RepID=A0ABQ7R827_PLUXY|nr:hypothetical protein JYU34_000532 [Plutella xylostella]
MGNGVSNSQRSGSGEHRSRNVTKWYAKVLHSRRLRLARRVSCVERRPTHVTNECNEHRRRRRRRRGATSGMRCGSSRPLTHVVAAGGGGAARGPGGGGGRRGAVTPPPTLDPAPAF